jgi:photosystem II stability/assembly factor-like uncharacterized protein
LVPGRILVGSNTFEPGNPEASFGMVFASDDYGQTWAYMGPTEPISSIVDIAYDAVDPDLVYLATNGTGHWKSNDGGATWKQMPFISAGGLSDQFAPHPTLSGFVVLATSGPAIFASEDGGENWMHLQSSTAYNINAPLVYVPTFPPTLYGMEFNPEYQGLMRSFDNGQTWEQVPEAPYPVRLAATSDGERVVLYIGSPGGLATQADTQTSFMANAIQGESTPFGGGVYRLTTLLPSHWIYLPNIIR